MSEPLRFPSQMGVEAGCDVDWSSFLEELHQGQALTQELHTHLGGGPFSVDQCRSMVVGILASWEKLRSMAKPIHSERRQQPLRIKLEPGTSFLESPCNHTPKKSLQNSPKKRKVLPTRTTQVHVPTSPGGTLETEDGYNWRKYGQKRILGARNPRGYYRCTHRFTQGCEALKMVQRSDEDPSLLEVTYKGEHTCCVSKKGEGGAKASTSQDMDLLGTFKPEEIRVKTEEDLDDGHTLAPTSHPAIVDQWQLTPSSGSTGVFSPIVVTPEAAGGFAVSPCFGESVGESYWCEREYEEILSAASSVPDSPTIADFFGFEELPPDFDSLFG